jgi:peptidoglycan-N-acetylglucosamine deacetylase
MLHLTFDDGPDPIWTPAVLDALAAVRATATFFVLGERAAAEPAVIERILADGHAVEVHGHGHLRHSATPRECVEGDLDAALAVLGTLNIAPRLWRAPYGDLAPWSAEVAAARGLELTGWSADTHDWTGASAEAMLASIEPLLSPGAIVLAHDAVGPGARRNTCEETVRLIRPLVAAARRRGLEPSRIPPREAIPPGNPDLAAASA